MNQRVLIISPVRNEAAHIERVVRAVAAQDAAAGALDRRRRRLRRRHAGDPAPRSRPRCRSSPSSSAAARLPEAVPDRLARAAAPRTFNCGLRRRRLARVHARDEARRRHRAAARLLRELHRALRGRPALGLAGGVLDEPDRRRRHAPHPDPARATSTARSSCYTRECFAAIGGVQERLGWDTIDETYARMRGFKARELHRTSSRSTTARSAAPTARCAATRATASAPTSRTSRPPWVALRAFKVAPPPPGRTVGARLLLRLRPGRRPPRRAGPRPRVPTVHSAGSCAGGCSARRSRHYRGAT